MPFTNVIIQPPANTNPSIFPEQGFYADLKYMYGDANGYNTVTAGPFPMDKKHLYLEFLNILEAMLARFPEGKGGFDDYEDVPGYMDYFDPEGSDDDADDDAYFRESLGLEPEYCPDSYGAVATLTQYETYYHDGESMAKYPVTPI